MQKSFESDFYGNIVELKIFCANEPGNNYFQVADGKNSMFSMPGASFL